MLNSRSVGLFAARVAQWSASWPRPPGPTAGGTPLLLPVTGFTGLLWPTIVASGAATSAKMTMRTRIVHSYFFFGG
ncbi:MAG: hypothetical protein DMD33_16930 [Gemmatimonadetes bacterium]|nr:MAG: hypothetical protein DMD33_16930 [Gemmatimonadota bacterium]PYO74011.1 MAG: hypothetical protein DMD67_14440 [Gemmatimonadota bacterium]